MILILLCVIRKNYSISCSAFGGKDGKGTTPGCQKESCKGWVIPCIYSQYWSGCIPFHMDALSGASGRRRFSSCIIENRHWSKLPHWGFVLTLEEFSYKSNHKVSQKHLQVMGLKTLVHAFYIIIMTSQTLCRLEGVTKSPCMGRCLFINDCIVVDGFRWIVHDWSSTLICHATGCVCNTSPGFLNINLIRYS